MNTIETITEEEIESMINEFEKDVDSLKGLMVLAPMEKYIDVWKRVKTYSKLYLKDMFAYMLFVGMRVNPKSLKNTNNPRALRIAGFVQTLHVFAGVASTDAVSLNTYAVIFSKTIIALRKRDRIIAAAQDYEGVAVKHAKLGLPIEYAFPGGAAMIPAGKVDLITLYINFMEEYIAVRAKTTASKKGSKSKAERRKDLTLQVIKMVTCFTEEYKTNNARRVKTDCFTQQVDDDLILSLMKALGVADE